MTTDLQLVVVVGGVGTYVPVTISDDDADAIGNALYGSEGRTIQLSLADEAGARIGVVGKFYDSEA